MISIATDSNRSKELALLENISRRDPSALSDLYDRYSTLLYSIILRIVGTAQAADEVLQEVFLAIWNRENEYDVRWGSPSVWLCRIARDYAVQRSRAQNPQHVKPSEALQTFHEMFADVDDSSSQHRSILTGQQEEILIALISLSNEQKEVIEYSYFRGYLQTEIAQNFKTPLSTVKTRMRTAMSILRQKLRNKLSSGTV